MLRTFQFKSEGCYLATLDIIQMNLYSNFLELAIRPTLHLILMNILSILCKCYVYISSLLLFFFVLLLNIINAIIFIDIGTIQLIIIVLLFQFKIADVIELMIIEKGPKSAVSHIRYARVLTRRQTGRI